MEPLPAGGLPNIDIDIDQQIRKSCCGRFQNLTRLRDYSQAFTGTLSLTLAALGGYYFYGASYLFGSLSTAGSIISCTCGYCRVGQLKPYKTFEKKVNELEEENGKLKNQIKDLETKISDLEITSANLNKLVIEAGEMTQKQKNLLEEADIELDKVKADLKIRTEELKGLVENFGKLKTSAHSILKNMSEINKDNSSIKAEITTLVEDEKKLGVLDDKLLASVTQVNVKVTEREKQNKDLKETAAEIGKQIENLKLSFLAIESSFSNIGQYSTTLYNSGQKFRDGATELERVEPDLKVLVDRLSDDVVLLSKELDDL